MRGGRTTSIQTWRPEDDRKAEAIREINDSLRAISKEPGTEDMLATLSGVTRRLAHGEPFRAAVILRDYAERQELRRGRL